MTFQASDYKGRNFPNLNNNNNQPICPTYSKSGVWLKYLCYGLKSLESDNRTTLVLSNIRELDRELFYKLVYLI